MSETEPWRVAFEAWREPFDGGEWGIGVVFQLRETFRAGWFASESARIADLTTALNTAEGELHLTKRVLTDLVRSSAAVESDLAEFGTIASGEGYAHWNATIDAASGWLAKDGPDSIDECNA